MAEAIGRDIEQVYRSANLGTLGDVELLQQITEACRECVGEFVRGGCRAGGNGVGQASKWKAGWWEGDGRGMVKW